MVGAQVDKSKALEAHSQVQDEFNRSVLYVGCMPSSPIAIPEETLHQHWQNWAAMSNRIVGEANVMIRAAPAKPAPTMIGSAPSRRNNTRQALHTAAAAAQPPPAKRPKTCTQPAAKLEPIPIRYPLALLIRF